MIGTTSSSRPIRIEREGIRRTLSNNGPIDNSTSILSKSLGDHYSGRNEERASLFLHRPLSDAISTISHAGYLLKRSNHPYPEISPPLFPVAVNNSKKEQQGDTIRVISPDDVQEAASCTTDSPQVNLRHAPQHFFSETSCQEESKAVTETIPNEDSNKAKKQEVGSELLASLLSLFGIEMPKAVKNEAEEPNNEAEIEQKRTTDATTTTTTTTTASHPPSTRRSSPIKVAAKKKRFIHPQSPIPPPSVTLSGISSHHDSLSGISTDPLHVSEFDDEKQQKQKDCFDDDGHIWRSKYCVLAGETLFFYPDQSVAESPEAAAERHRYQYEAAEAAVGTTDLSHSPMPPRFTSSIEDDHNHLWEKRVALECVGAVRSAELDYGPHSFELLAGDDISDKLVLRARNNEEMNEWLFQFHRCIASFVRDMMDHVVPAAPLSMGDIHHPTFQHAPMQQQQDSKTSPSRDSPPIRSGSLSMASASFSPRYQKMVMNACTGTTLSHGHGRSSLHRRRMELPPASSTRASYSSSEELSPGLPFPMFSDRPPSGRLVTPMLPRYSDGTASTASPTQNSASPVDTAPEMCAPQSDYPETERPPPAQGKYVPPHLRNRESSSQGVSGVGRYVPPHLRSAAKKYVPPHLRSRNQGGTTTSPPQDRYVPRHVRHNEPDVASSPPGFTLLEQQNGVKMPVSSEEMSAPNYMRFGYDDDDNGEQEEYFKWIKLGGCADPESVEGSILDERFIPRKASRLGKVRSSPFGYESAATTTSGLQWEIGAFSECGIRDSNEDSYLVTSDLVRAFTAMEEQHSAATFWDQCNNSHPPGLFAIFDGHCGDHCSRFAAERLTRFIYEESRLADDDTIIGDCVCNPDFVQQILDRAIRKLDEEFCRFCVHGDRQWESGSTALIAALANEHLIIANLGDARGILGRSVADSNAADFHEANGWNELPFDDYNGERRCLWKEVTDVHSPNREDERTRIEAANGWVTTEKEIPIGQLKRMALYDDDVIDILKRCFADRYQPSPKASAPHRFLQISRVCGELAVSRSLGDRDFKAFCNISSNTCATDGAVNPTWDPSHLFLSYPEGHNQAFIGDLISNKADFQAIRVGEEGVSEEFLLLACDGLWDVIDADDAYRVTRDLLFEKQWSAKKAAGRLAELAVHLGSSDNITVIVVRFLDRSK